MFETSTLKNEQTKKEKLKQKHLSKYFANISPNLNKKGLKVQKPGAVD